MDTLCHRLALLTDSVQDGLVFPQGLLKDGRIGQYRFQGLPKIRAMPQYVGVSQFVKQHVVDQIPRQLHQKQVQYDVGLLVAAAPAALQALDADAGISKAVRLGQARQTLRQQLFGLGAQRPDGGLPGDMLDLRRGRAGRGRMADNNAGIVNPAAGFGRYVLRHELQVMGFADSLPVRQRLNRVMLAADPHLARPREVQAGPVWRPRRYADPDLAGRRDTQTQVPVGPALVNRDGKIPVKDEVLAWHNFCPAGR